MKKIFITIIIILLVVTGFSFFMLQKIGNIVISSLIDSEFNKVDEVDLLPEDSGTSISQNQGNKPNEPLYEEQQGILDENQPSTSNRPFQEENSETKPIEGHMRPAESTEPAGSQAAIIPVDKIQEIKDKVSWTDKITAATIVLDKLTKSDISELQGMLFGGLDKEESQKAKRIAYERFSPEEIEKVKELYYKYMN
jgi:hypothetical protein